MNTNEVLKFAQDHRNDIEEEKNCGACGQYFLEDEADEKGFHSEKFCDASEGTLLLEQKQFCLTCEELKELEQGEAVVRYGAFVEFTCYECKGAN